MTASICGRSRRWENFFKTAVLHLLYKQLKNICERVQFLVKLKATGLLLD